MIDIYNCVHCERVFEAKKPSDGNSAIEDNPYKDDIYVFDMQILDTKTNKIANMCYICFEKLLICESSRMVFGALNNKN